MHEASSNFDCSINAFFLFSQKTAWIDFLMAAVQKAGEKAAAAEVEFRRGLPLRFLQYLGTGIQHVSSGTDSSLASSFPSSSTASSSSSLSSSSASQVSESDAMAIPSFFSKDASVQRDQLQHQFGNRLSQMFDLLKPYLNMHDAADQFSGWLLIDVSELLSFGSVFPNTIFNFFPHSPQFIDSTS
jgi:hypothetical protein